MASFSLIFLNDKERSKNTEPSAKDLMRNISSDDLFKFQDGYPHTDLNSKRK